MKILVNPDSVPATLEECLENIKKYLDEQDIEQISAFDKNPFQKEKIGAVTFLKNAWSLTDVESMLVKYFKSEYGIDNGDDIATLILHCIYRDIKGVPREEKELAESFRKPKKKIKKEIKPEN